MFLLSTMSADFFSPMARQLRMGKGLLFVEALPSHSVRQTTLGGLLWTSDRPDAQTSTLQRTTLKNTHIHAPCGIRAAIPANERPQTHALVSAAATGTGQRVQIRSLKSLNKFVAFYLYRQQVDRLKTGDCNKGCAVVLHAVLLTVCNGHTLEARDGMKN